MSSFLIYKSSAGSGKTFTLVKEYLKLTLADKLNSQSTYRKILALTFTNKAAAEMKERIIKALKEIKSGSNEFLTDLLADELKITGEEIKKRAAKLLTEILHNYGNFSISTIDSFTHNIIRNFAHDLKLPVNFNIEMDEANVLEKCIDQIITKIGTDKEVTKLILDFSKNNIDSQKNWQVDRDLKSFASTALRNKADAKIELLKDLSINDFNSIRNKIYSENKSYEQKLAEIGNMFSVLLSKNHLSNGDFANKDKGIPGYFNKLANSKFDSELNNSYVLKAVNENNWYISTQKPEIKSAIDGIVNEILSLYHRAEKLIEEYHGKYILRNAILKNLFSLSLINELEKQVAVFKEEENILFISEFNERISDLILSEPVPFIYEKLGEKYKHFLLDEFQDTSSLQWQNLIPLIDNSLAEGNFNLIVGDGKQSIYRWRGGEAEQFEALPKLPLIKDSLNKDIWEENLSRNAVIKELTTNFRSKKNIIDFNNSFFHFIRDNKLTNEWKDIYRSVSQNPVAGNTGGMITIDLIDAKNEEAEELLLTKKYIRKNLELGYKFSDMVVLVRNRKNGDQIANYLTEEKIPVISSEALLLNNCSDIKFIIHVLRFMAQPDNAVALSCIINFMHNNEMIGSKKKGELMIEANQGRLRQNFIDILKNLGIDFNLKSITALPLMEIVILIIEKFKLTKYKAYVNFFIDAIIDFTSKNTNSIAAFLDWWEEKKSKLSLIIPEGIDAINIMTIHKSKGLEFPIVIMPFSSWRITPKTNIVWTDAENELPIAYVNNNKELREKSGALEFNNEAQKQLLDTVNLMYVAFTRAVNHLHLVTRPDSQNAPSSFQLLKEYIEFNKITLDENRHVSIGEPLNNMAKAKVDNNYKISTPLKNWNNVINIKSNSVLENENDSRQYGVLIHKLLSEINSLNDITSVINKSISEGILGSLESEKIKTELTEILKIPEIGQFFTENLEAFNEMEILSYHGNVLRPDRIIVEKDLVKIIDFKTGKHSDEYISQLESYANALLQLGYKNCKKYLIYIGERKVVECY